MKILLAAVNARYIHSNPAVFLLRACADKKRQEKGLTEASPLEIAEYTINMPEEEILEDIVRREPDCLVFSCYIWNRVMIDELLDDLALIRPALPVWLGGPEAYCGPEAFFKDHENVTVIMRGEGEETFTELVNYFEDGYECSAGRKKEPEESVAECSRGLTQKEKAPEKDGGMPEEKGPDAIPGLLLRDAGPGLFHATADRRPLAMDDIPFPYGDLSGFENRIIYYESSRGCPYRCAYCLSSVEKGLRFRSLDLVKKELAFFLEKRVPQVKFIDRTFNADPKRCREIWHFLRENDNGVTNFHFEIAGDILTDEEIEEIREMRPGLIQLEIGVQSTCREALQAVNRRTDFDRLRSSVAAIRSFGNVHQHLDLIAGLPYEGMQSFRKSFNEVYAMQPHELQLGFLKVLKGSPMQALAEKYGIRAMSRPPYEVLSTPWLSYQELRELKRVEDMLERLGNSGQYTVTLPVLESLFETPFEFYESAALYFEKAAGSAKLSRAAQLSLLLDFAADRARELSLRNEGKGIGPGRLSSLMPDELRDLLRETLTVDFYLREKGRSRPSFARDISAFKKICRAYDEGGRYHAEIITWEMNGEIRRADSPRLMTFDYEHRDPLTGNARTEVIYFTEEEISPFFSE